MKVRMLINAATLMALLLGLCLAADKPNISGTWVLDKTRSFSNAAGLDQTMTIVHKGDEVKLDGKIILPQRETVISETWTLDGKEYEFTPSGAAAGVKGKRKAYWLPGHRGIVVEDETPTTGPNGPTTQRTTRRYVLSSDGMTLTADYFIDNPRGSFEAKRVFVKRG